MTRIERLKEKIETLYSQKNPSRADWADWLYENHIFVVAEYAKELSRRYHAREDLAIAAGMLHDVADAVMARENPQHEEKSREIARQLLKESNFLEDEIGIIIDDAIRFHSCRGNDMPQTFEGKIMATADALAHLKTNFYDFALVFLKKKETMAEIRDWALPKIERDYRKKIFFDEVRVEATDGYERVKNLFVTLK